MPDLSSLGTPAPYHVLTYGTLLGVSVWQSFIGGVVAYKALPRPHFSALQQKLFPIYFALQSALPVALAATYPSSTAPRTLASSVSGTLAPENRYTVLLPVATMFATSVLNLLFVGPWTTRVMKDRKAQEVRDGKKSYDAGPHSAEMQKLNRAFGKMHGMSSLLNMAGLMATVYYGFVLGERMH